jgi:TPR repeat protein
MICRFFRLLVLPVLLLCGSAPVLAQYDEGQKAFDSGDYGQAQGLWQKGADSGDARSQYSLGYLAQFGLAGSADLGAAKGWYEKAAAQKNPDALYALGLMQESGTAGEKNLARAFDYYHQAAEAGLQPDAEYALGRMLLRGRGVARDAKESLKWLRRAAQHDQPAGQYMLAESFEAGWGTSVNDGEAYYWYRRAELGDRVELQEQDVAFEPKIAIAALKKRLPADIIAFWDEKLQGDLARKKKPVAPAKGKEALTKPADK